MTMSARAWRVGIGIGTAHTVAMLRAPGMPPRPILAGGSPLAPSSADPVYPGHRDPLRPGSLLPHRLTRIAAEVRRAAGPAEVETTVACPPEWPDERRQALAETVMRAGLTGVEVVSETVAAAAFLGDELAVGASLLVIDAGAGSCDVGVVRRTAGGYEQVGFETLEGTGGIRLDADLVALVGARIAAQDRAVWHRLDDPLTPVDRAARLQLWERVRALKEELSFAGSATLTVPLADTGLTVTREEFEAVARPVLARVVRALTGVGPASALLLVGGGSRIPLLRAVLEAATGLEAITVREPELVVAEGCASLARREAPLIDDDVQFTVYRPTRLPPGRWESLLVFAHKSDPVVDPVTGPLDPVAAVSERAARFFGGDPVPSRTVDARRPLARGAEIRVVPDLPGVECNPREAVLDWQEPVHEVAFRLRATATAPEVVRGFVRVWCGPVVLAEVSIALPVAAGGAEVERRPEPIRRYRRIFPSYSSRDRAIVDEFATVARALGDQYLQDVVTLRSGEQWSPRLLELIAEADVFQLFWSSNSMVSPNCRAEWECALGLGRPSFVRPLYWEQPLPEAPHLGLPPEQLRRLHFARVAVTTTPAAVIASAPAVPAPRSSATRPESSACLEVVDGGPRDRILLLPRERPVIIGSGPDADLPLADSYASRRHAEVVVSLSGERFWVGDLGSTNGTTLNGRRLTGREPLDYGDVIGVGSTRLKLTRLPAPGLPDHLPQQGTTGEPAGPGTAPPRPGRAREPRSSGLIATGLTLVIAGAAWWLLSAYAGTVVGLGALIAGLALLVTAWRRR